MIKKIFNSSKGFTVLESIVAIAILSLSISGAFSAVQQGLSQSTLAKDEVKAFYLAQEAIEVIRNKRDNNQLNRISTGVGTWLDGIASTVDDPCWFGKVCKISAPTYPNNGWAVRCGDEWGTCENLRQHSTNYMYNYTTTNPVTNFKREVQIESINATEIAVTVQVSWTKGAINKNFKVKTHLFSWVQTR